MKNAKWAIVLMFLLICLLSSCAAGTALSTKDKIIGKWKVIDSQGEQGYFVFDESGYAKMILSEGVSDDDIIGSMSFKYQADYSSSPNTLDFIYYKKSSGEEVGRMENIIEFITPDKIKIGSSKNYTRPEGFDSLSKEDTAILVRVKENLSVAEEKKENRFKVDLDAITKETQQTYQKGNKLMFVWWTPEEYWQATFDNDPSVTKDQAESILKVLRQYTMVSTVSGSIGPFGAIEYRPETDIRESIRISDSKGNVYPPLRKEEIDMDARNFLSMMKPIISNAAGPLGQNMHFFLFPAKNKKGKKVVEAKKEGVFLVKLGQKEFRWRLPLSSLFAKKTCPFCKEKLSGAYKFCPWDGAKLP